jgi:two-component system, NtrC family, sensor kinase
MTLAPGFRVRMDGLRGASGVFALAAAIVLAAILGYLYHRSQGADFKRQSEVLGRLRELKAINARWDVDILRNRTEFALAPAPAVDYSAQLNRIRQDLLAAAKDTDSASLKRSAAELTVAFAQKAELVDRYRNANAATKQALRQVLSADAEIAGLVRGSWPDFRDRDRLVAAESAVTQLLAEAQRYYFSSGDAPRKNVEALLSDLRGAAAQLPPAVRDGLARLDEHVQQLLGAKPIEDAAYHKLSLITAGPRVDSLNSEFLREQEAMHGDREFYRAYLTAYAGVLLVLIGYLVARLIASYRRLDRAKDELELRVIERSHELSEALGRLKESEAQLIQTGNMSSLGQMIAGVAHEINTPLAYVRASLGSVESKLPHLALAIAEAEKLVLMLKDGAGDPDAIAEQYARVQDRIARLGEHGLVSELQGLLKDGLHGIDQISEIVGSLRNFARLDHSKVASFDLNEGLDRTLLIAKHELKRHTVQKQYGDIPPIICSPSQINQVLLNLINNAAQAIESGHGTIKLTTRRENDAQVAVEIEDNGKGIPPDVLARIFDPFFTTKGVGKGTGLGLPVSHRIVEQHGGKITVDSAVGIGTKVRMVLPLTAHATEELAA